MDEDILDVFCKSDPVIEKKTALKDGYLNTETMLPHKKQVKATKKLAREARSRHKGKGWFNLPAQEMTEERKNDLTILQMRDVVDPKRFYKKNLMKTLPKYFQVGTVIESPADFYHSRVPRKERKQTIVEELLADAQFKKYNKKRYAEVKASEPARSRMRKHKKKKMKDKKK